LGDIGLLSGQPPTYLWDFRYKWLQAIYRNHFGITPSIELTGTLAQYVFPDYRVLRNGSVLLALLNGHTNSATVTVNASTLLSGKTVENLTSGGIVEMNSDGLLDLTLTGDQYVLLYAYNASGPAATSVLNTNRNKIWFENVPTAVWPDGNNATVTVGFDTVTPGLELVVAFERRMLPAKVYGQSARLPVSGNGVVSVPLPVPDADLNDIDYLSAMQGGSYQWHAWLEQGAVRLSEVSLPVQLLWGVRPESLPATVAAGNNYQVTLRWEDLPSYEQSEGPSPLSRADRWEPLKAKQQFYNVILELRNGSGTVATDTFLTSTGTDSHLFSIHVPGNAVGPFNWFASLRPVRDVSHDVFDSFEDRATGATTNSPFPWRSYVYSENNTAQWFAEGVYTNRASEGRQGAFLIVSNPPTSGSYAGFGFYYPLPTSWALPINASEWANYTFAFDFKEESNLPCVLEVQLKDVRGGTLTLARSYVPGANGWATSSGSLNEFVVSATPGFFDPSQVSSLFLNVQMLQKSKTYFMTFDNVRFDGPERIPTVLSAIDVHDTFEDRTGGSDPLLIKPWDAYAYSDAPTSNMVLAVGVGTEATFGGHSAFMIVTNPASVGTFSGFLLIRPFSQIWSLPVSQAEWTNYVFSWDFKETSGRACILELQIKDTSNSLLHYTNAYNPGPNGWQTISARLNQFRKPSWVTNDFDSNNIKELLVIVQMLEKTETYFGFFDNIHFSGPTTVPPLEPVRALYRSDNDSARDTDFDGLSDAYEMTIGTNPNRWDTDGDGVSDRDELIAGTNPNSALDVLRIQSISNQGGHPVLSWMARSNRVYDLHFFDGSLRSDAQFCPVEALTSIRSTTNGLLQVNDPSGIGAPLRTYRLSVHQP
ncbi:MAG TPA: thrombospondin type 3 repeat-containing protein, partial [Candidatus Binatia bacterium]|nr:thrombospondin type 3 repeat-containing protein [Candidatus Binatia bacterium]